MANPSPPTRNQPPEPLERLTGLIERVTFHSQESGFGVLQVKVRGRQDLASVIGTAPEINPGEWIEAQGHWVIDREHGQQFKALLLRAMPPNTTEGMQKYLGSGLIKGIGPAMACRLVEAFGLQVFEVIEKNPQRLCEVSGIGKGRQGKIVSGWNDQRVVREIMVFLHSHGVSTSRAFRIFKTYGDQATRTVMADEDGLPVKLRVIQLLNGREKCVHVEVEDGAGGGHASGIAWVGVGARGSNPQPVALFTPHRSGHTGWDTTTSNVKGQRMATYEFRCKKCKRIFEKTMSFSEHERSKPACPKCKSRSVEQRPSVFQTTASSKG